MLHHHDPATLAHPVSAYEADHASHPNYDLITIPLGLRSWAVIRIYDNGARQLVHHHIGPNVTAADARAMVDAWLTTNVAAVIRFHDDSACQLTPRHIAPGGGAAEAPGLVDEWFAASTTADLTEPGPWLDADQPDSPPSSYQPVPESPPHG